MVSESVPDTVITYEKESGTQGSAAGSKSGERGKHNQEEQLANLLEKVYYSSPEPDGQTKIAPSERCGHENSDPVATIADSEHADSQRKTEPTIVHIQSPAVPYYLAAIFIPLPKPPPTMTIPAI